MSHESDMLPAISTIAGQIRGATGYTYLAGLWQEDLHTGLLWYADGPKATPRIWRAPSWSWAQLRDQFSRFIVRDLQGAKINMI